MYLHAMPAWTFVYLNAMLQWFVLSCIDIGIIWSYNEI